LIENGGFHNYLCEFGAKAEITAFKRTSKFYTSGLYKAITDGDQKKAQKLLTEDKMLIWEDGLGAESALILAVKYENLPMIKLLLSLESSLAKSDRDGCGMTPLHWAVRTGNKEIAEFLIEHIAWYDSFLHDKFTVEVGQSSSLMLFLKSVRKWISK